MNLDPVFLGLALVCEVLAAIRVADVRASNLVAAGLAFYFLSLLT